MAQAVCARNTVGIAVTHFVVSIVGASIPGYALQQLRGWQSFSQASTIVLTHATALSYSHQCGYFTLLRDLR